MRTVIALRSCVCSILSFFFSLFLSESQPPGQVTELIDCALQIDFEQKVCARRPRTEGRRGEGGGETVLRFRSTHKPRVFKKLLDALSARNGPGYRRCVTTSLSARAKEGEEEASASSPFIQQDGRNSAVVDRRDTLSRHASPSCGSIHSRNEIGTAGARAQLYGNYIRFYRIERPDIVRRRVIDRLFGDIRAAARTRSSSLLLVPFVRESLFRNTGHFNVNASLTILYCKFVLDGFVQDLYGDVDNGNLLNYFKYFKLY